MSQQLIINQTDFDALCEELASSPIVGFDTEFVSESYYRPRLCLMQFAVGDRVVAVDPFEIPDLSRWWRIMAGTEAEGARPTIVVHGGREEVRFCLNFAESPPSHFVDVQVAEGLLSHGFPLGYENLVQRVLGIRLAGGQTRTDWQRRPLTTHQLDYALEDVRNLLAVWNKQSAELARRGRLDWATQEFQKLIADVLRERDQEAWRRLPGAAKLTRRELAVLRALHAWRETYASRLDRPARVALRDDLLVEIAQRKPKTTNELTLLRGIQVQQRMNSEVLEVVQAALNLPTDDHPAPFDSTTRHPRDEILVRILSLALADRCSGLGLSQTMVGNSADLHEIVRWHVHDRQSGSVPRLLQAWRGEICGDYLTDVLEGRVLLAVGNPKADQPLRFINAADAGYNPHKDG